MPVTRYSLVDHLAVQDQAESLQGPSLLGNYLDQPGERLPDQKDLGSSLYDTVL